MRVLRRGSGGEPTGPICRRGRACASPDLPYTAPMEFSSDTFRLVMGHFATGVPVVTVFDGDQRRGDHGQRPELGEPRATAGDGRPRPAPAHRPGRPGAGRYAVNVLAEDAAGAVRLLRRRADLAGSRRVLRRHVATGRDRPAPHRRVHRDASSARSSRPFSVGDHDLFIGHVDALANGERSPEPAALLPAPLPARRAARTAVAARQAEQ